MRLQQKEEAEKPGAEGDATAIVVEVRRSMYGVRNWNHKFISTEIKIKIKRFQNLKEIFH